MKKYEIDEKFLNFEQKFIFEFFAWNFVNYFQRISNFNIFAKTMPNIFGVLQIVMEINGAYRSSDCDYGFPMHVLFQSPFFVRKQHMYPNQGEVPLGNFFSPNFAMKKVHMLNARCPSNFSE